MAARGYAANDVEVIEADLGSLGLGGPLDSALAAAAPFDIIVDDASHADAEVAGVFEELFFDESIGLAPGGLYVVLDTQPSYRAGGSRLARFKALSDAMQWSGTTIVSAAHLEMFVAHTDSKEEAWVDAVEFHRGFVVVRKRGARGA
uniref:Uncharacterized protein n=1 Tax=Alexandrium catenella TaxID=2925 RepID=A0A7S1W7K4_ALECA